MDYDMKWSYYHKLRKYSKRKYRSKFNEWINILYYRYFFKFYGNHKCLWEID